MSRISSQSQFFLPMERAFAMTVSSGEYAEENPFRFSSEYSDMETGLVYYNYRYYSPELGRWLSRDPIEEQGGYNLYGMLGNDIVNSWDQWGYGHAWRCPIAAYSWAMTGNWNATSEELDAAHEVFWGSFNRRILS